jgi:hypothetical protein
MPDLEKTLSQLEGPWVDQSTHPTPLMDRCCALRKKRLKDFATEDLRIMIGQNIGLKFLVPLALERLQEDPLAEGDYYPGDLLHNVLSVEPLFWKSHPDLRGRAAQVSWRATTLVDERGEGDVVKKALAEALKRFEGSEA